jgi:signal transduction histidine kinase
MAVPLEASKPFRNLSQIELAALRHIAFERRFPANAQIFKEGDNGDGVYVVTAGQVEISARVAENTRRVIAQIGPGEMFGEMAVLELKPRSATATATKDTIAYFIPRDELRVMVERSPVLSLELLGEISHRLREFNQRYVQEILQTERLALIGRFARAIVHDLKNPLNIIGLTAEVASMENATLEARRNAAVTIRKQVERVTDMVAEILSFTQGGQTEYVLTSNDYGKFVQQVIEDIRPEVELRKCSLELAGVPLGVQLPFDPRRIRRVFHNLIYNAADAMRGGGVITLHFHLDGTDIVTEIEDHGPGIAPEIAGKLFEAFATYGKAHGTGLGLSICKKILEDHHGRIWANNKPVRGAVFSFALPLAR